MLVHRDGNKQLFYFGPGLHPFDNMAIIYWVKSRKLWVHETPIFEVILDPGTSEISTPPDVAVGTHFHAHHGIKTVPVFLPDDAEASWLLFQIWSPDYHWYYQTAVQPENTAKKVRISMNNSWGVTFSVMPPYLY